jgi:hypothetical protein
MITFLTTEPLWLTSVILIGLTTLISMVVTILVRRHVGLDKLKSNNEVAGFKFATVGCLYAVMLGFAVVVVWQKFSDAENVVVQEAGAAATIFRLSAGLGGETGQALRKSVKRYIVTVVDKDWPAMEGGTGSDAATRALDDAYLTLQSFQPVDARESALYAEALHELGILGEARRARLVFASGAAPGVVWIVLFGGGVLTIGFTLFFGTANIRAQSLMTGALCALICSALFIIVEIDRPFSGSVKVGPEALSMVLDDFSVYRQ